MEAFLAAVILLHVSQHASAETLAVGVGETVTLPCQAPPPVPVQALVEWKHIDPNLTVHVRRDGRDQPNEQNEAYRSRMSLRADALTSGDLSLTLRNTAALDEGAFICSARTGQTVLFTSTVQLEFTKEYKYYALFITFLILFILALAGWTVSGVMVYKKYSSKDRTAANL